MSSKVQNLLCRINMICTQSKVVQEYMLLKQLTYYIHIQSKWDFMAAPIFHKILVKANNNFTIHKPTTIIKVFPC
jgi:hypothetical protein